MAQTSFDIDEKTAQVLDGLKKVYGVQSNAGVLKRALAIALIAAKHADEDHNIRLLSTKAGKEREVIVPQRA